MTETQDRVAEAAAEYLHRQARVHHPQGHRDHASRFVPNDSERQACCVGVRPPSISYPHSLSVHCRTMRHVANLYGVAVADVRRAVAAKKEHDAVSRP